jgi:uncharacterized membrane protein
MIMKSIRFFFLPASLLIVLSHGCTRAVGDPQACYNDRVKDIIVQNCTSSGCHNPNDREADYDFTTYEGVMQAVKRGHSAQSELYAVIKDNQMPPAYPLTQEEKSIIKTWINNGAGNNSCKDEVCDTTSATFSEVQAIMNESCVGCHRESNMQGGISLDSYQHIVDAASANKLLGTIKHEPGYPPMPQFGTKLSNCKIAKIEKWIRMGMPE